MIAPECSSRRVSALAFEMFFKVPHLPGNEENFEVAVKISQYHAGIRSECLQHTQPVGYNYSSSEFPCHAPVIMLLV
jgi:hypothetical protein